MDSMVGQSIRHRLSEKHRGRTSTPDIETPLRQPQETFEWRGIEIQWTRLGEISDPDLVLLHGLYPSASSREWIRIAEELSASFHVLVPDLPGFGVSDKLPISYSPGLYEAFLQDFLIEYTDNPLCVATGITGLYLATISEPGMMRHIVLVNPSETYPGKRFSMKKSSFLSSILTILSGYLLQSGIFQQWILEQQLLFDSSALSREDARYMETLLELPHAEYPLIAGFTGKLDSKRAITQVLNEIDVPVTLLWGRANLTTLGHVYRSTTVEKTIILDRTRILPQYEHPDRFMDVLRQQLPNITSQSQ